MSASVNRPTDPKVRDADIENKLRLYGIYNAFAQGKVPSNKQIDVALNSALESKALASPSTKLSEEGKHLVTDLKTVISEAKLLLLTKNHDQAIQEFIWHTEQATQTTSGPTPNAPVNKNQAQQDGQQALAGLRTLGTLIITNGQFRKLLSDATVLLRDIASDAAQKSAGKLQPDQEKLAQIDRPAEDNTWHEAPDLSRDNIKNNAKQTFNKNAPVNVDDVKAAAGDATQAAHPDGSRDPRDFRGAAEHEAKTGESSGVDAKGGANAALDRLKNSKDDGKIEEHKDKAREYRDRSQDYLKGKMPQERRDQTIYRLKKMVAEIQGHQDYQQAIDTLLYLAETYAGHTKNVTQQTSNTVASAHDDNHLQSAERLFRTILERFANNTSSADLVDSINDIYRDADNDPQLKGWFREADGYVRKCLKEQGFILTDTADEEYNKLYDKGHYLLRDRYRNHTDRIVDEFKFIGDQFAQDPQNKQFGNSIQKLLDDLGTDENGKAVFKKHLVTDITSVILPGFFEGVRYVPVPRIEYSDPAFDAIIENLVIESDNLMPNVLEFGNDSYFRWGRKNIASKNNQSFMVSVSGVQCDLKDVSYYIKKKQGFPSLTDTGLMDIFLGGDGFSFKLKLASADAKNQANFFTVEKVDVSIKHMNIKLKQSKHKLLFNLFKPLLLKVVRPVIQKVLEKQIKTSFNDFDRKLYGIKREADKASEDLKNNPDPENAKNVYQRYADAAKKEFTQKKQKAEEKTADKHANIAITKEDSMFKDISLPGGVSTAATKYKQMAREGSRWESPVFSLGKSRETSSLPKPIEITRKSHGAGRANLRSARDSGADFEQPAVNYSGQYGSLDRSEAYQNTAPSGGFAQPASQTGATGYGSSGTQQPTGQAGSTGYGSSATYQPSSGYEQQQQPSSEYQTSSGYEQQPSSTHQPYEAGATRPGPYEELPQGTKPGEYTTNTLSSNIQHALGR